jgi:phosphate starvation-inducible protein PhoH and related proteins
MSRWTHPGVGGPPVVAARVVSFPSNSSPTFRDQGADAAPWRMTIPPTAFPGASPPAESNAGSPRKTRQTHQSQPSRRSLFLSKHVNKKRRRNARSSGTAEIIELHGSKFEIERLLPPIKALNPAQAEYLDALRTSPQVVVLGPAGTGKTWIAATHAADLYRQRQIAKIILSRPNVPCGRSLGFFPGSLEDKFAPWAAPIAEAIKERIGKAAYDIALKNGDIELVPFEVMRGRSWKQAFVLLDEAQNTTPAEIKTFLTRVGEDCSVVINGDVSQCDLDEASGLSTVLHLIRSRSLPVPVIEFGLRDIVRSGLCAMWVRAFEEASTS